MYGFREPPAREYFGRSSWNCRAFGLNLVLREDLVSLQKYSRVASVPMLY